MAGCRLDHGACVVITVKGTEPLRKWTKALRETPLHQVNGTLFEKDDAYLDDDGDYLEEASIVGACCLGICILDLGGPEAAHTSFGQDLDGVVHTLLGITWEEDEDVTLDWPEEYMPKDLSSSNVSAAWLNDSAHCTFAQIADLVDYMGVRSDG